MSNHRADEKVLTDYCQTLMLALRLKDVPGDRIGEIVAEVESHVCDTGEDPTEAFGSPRAYAEVLTEGRPGEPWWSVVVNVVSAGVGGWFIAQGALGLLLGETYLDQSGWLWLALGLVMALPSGVIVYRRSTRILDPRTGKDMTPASYWALAALIGLPILLVVVAWGVIAIFAP
ncbi:MAG: hypothetical protein WA966_01515 [Ornithinimicrobium sp.]